MKTTKSFLKTICIFFSAIILLQGCTVYKSASVSLNEAVQAETKVKIKTNKDKILKFKILKFEDGHYYGINEIYKDDPFNTSKKEIIKTKLDVSEIEVVKIKNKTMSTILPFAVPLVMLGVLIIAYTIPTW